MTPDEIFQLHFSNAYPPNQSLAQLRTNDANPGNNPNIFHAIEEAAHVFASMANRTLGETSLSLDFSDRSIHELSHAINRSKRDFLAQERHHGQSVLFHFVTHGTLYVGSCIVKNHDGKWLVRNPLWESLVRLDSKAGIADLAIFQWWLKSLSDDEIDQPRLAERYRTYVEVPMWKPDDLTPILTSSRAIPRLAKVKYDILHKHLKAHLPELRDLGADFPSPERFAEMNFRSLDFHLLGDGRVLLMHGPVQGGIQFFWIGSQGFLKSMHIPTDQFPEPIAKLTGEILQVTFSLEGKTNRHEMMWWGA